MVAACALHDDPNFRGRGILDYRRAFALDTPWPKDHINEDHINERSPFPKGAIAMTTPKATLPNEASQLADF